MPTRCNRGFYCRSYCLLNMFRAPLCLSSGAAASCKQDTWPSAPHQTSNLKTTARNTTGSNHCIILLSSWWWAQWCPKNVEQAIRSAIKTSVASRWHFISTDCKLICTQCSQNYQHFPFKHFDITQMKIVHEQVAHCMPISIYYRLFYELWTPAKCIQISLIHISVPPSFSLKCL